MTFGINVTTLEVTALLIPYHRHQRRRHSNTNMAVLRTSMMGVELFAKYDTGFLWSSSFRKTWKFQDIFL